MKKKFVYAIFLVIIITSCIAGLIFAGSNDAKPKKLEEKEEKVVVKLLGEEEVIIYLNEDYRDEGAIVVIEGKETSEEYMVTSEIDNTVPGEYIIRYTYLTYETIRKVKVVDNILPELSLIGSKTITLAEGEKYTELGYTATDNIDGNLTAQVIIEGTIEKKVGTYTLTYMVSDEAGNTAIDSRTVNVVKKKTTRQAKDDNKTDQPNKTSYSNEITKMEYINNGIKITGTNERSIDSVTIVDSGGIVKYTYTVTKSGNEYVANVALNNLSNGRYTVYLNGADFSEQAINKQSDLLRLGRFKLESKLITFDYTNNGVQLIVQDFEYKYDILIDVGHGGRDPGAVNSTHEEKVLNLIVSLYEKQRYEEHGLNVLITRSGDLLEVMRGDSDWAELSRRVYAMGYFGVQSKIIYSNHHNSFGNTSRMGPEILVPAKLTSSELAPELKIMDLWTDFTPLTENHVRFYTRNYYTDSIHSKANGEVYNITNYYAVNRVPYNIFNVKAVIFEPAYMSNKANFSWYWSEENWIEMSEMKIKTYVEHLGITYRAPK